MLPRFQSFNQRKIKIAYNAFAEQLKTIYPDLTPMLDDRGYCFGLSFNYAKYASDCHKLIANRRGGRREFIAYLQFLDSLNGNFDFLVDHFKQKDSFDFVIDNQYSIKISIDGIVEVIKDIISLQDRNLLLPPAIWEKNYTFICPLEKLAEAFRIADLRKEANKIFFLRTPNHIFTIEWSGTGYYLFEPNNISIHSIVPILMSEADLAKRIIENCKRKIDVNNLIGFQISHVSFDVENSYIASVYQTIMQNYSDLIQRLDLYYLFENLKEYKISYVDFLFTLLDKINEFLKINNDQILLCNFNLLQTDLCRYLKDEIIKFNKFLEFSRPYIFEKAFKIKSPLHIFAASKNQIPLIKSLIANNIDVNQPMKDDRLFALYFAAQNNYIDLANLLIQHGANVDQVSSGNVSSLDIAIAQNQLPMIKLLIENKANIYRAESPALQLAVEFNRYTIVELLINNHANINYKPMHGLSPLDIAIEAGHLQMVKFLLSYGATWEPTNFNSPIIIQTAFQQLVYEELQKYEKANKYALINWVQSNALDLDMIFGVVGSYLITFADQLIAQAALFKSTDLLRAVITRRPELSSPPSIEYIAKSSFMDQYYFSAKAWLTIELNKLKLPSLQHNFSLYQPSSHQQIISPAQRKRDEKPSNDSIIDHNNIYKKQRR